MTVPEFVHNAEFWHAFLYRLCETAHRVLVLLDDLLCETFGFSRRPRGKFDC